MPDVPVARCFVYSAADGIQYEFACGTVYPGMSDEFAADWYVVQHCEAAVRARGGALLAYRQLLTMDPADGLYKPFSGWAPIMLHPSINPEYVQTLQLGDKPLFQGDIDSLGDVERPEIDLPVMPANSFGFGNYRRWSVGLHNRPRNTTQTVRVFPGDGVSPPVGKVVDPDSDRSRREAAEHFRLQQNQLRVVTEQAQRYTAELSAQPAPAPRPITAEAAIWRDPREVQTAPARIEHQPQIAARDILDHVVYSERVRARLERRPVAAWAMPA